MDLLSQCNQGAKFFNEKLHGCYVPKRHYVLPLRLIVKRLFLLVECISPWSLNHENVADGFTDFRTFHFVQI